MTLKCRRCRGLIEPQDQMLAVTLGRPARWDEAENTATRLAYAPGVWHYRCAPKPVRRYASAVAVTVAVAAAVILAVLGDPLNGLDSVQEIMDAMHGYPGGISEPSDT